MMSKIIKLTVSGCLFVLLLVGVSFAQNNNSKHHDLKNQKKHEKPQMSPSGDIESSELKCIEKHNNDEFYDPLTPQLFVFDKTNNVFGAINNIDNTIDIIRYLDGELIVAKRILVDEFEGRHDVQFVYRPQGIAVYENHIVYLASHRDSCYLAVLDLEGNIKTKLFFRGSAYAFSYSKSAQELYIAGQNKRGYDLIAISTAKGIENLSLDDTPSIHYRKPQKAAEIIESDPYGIGIAAVAMGVVFLSLLLLTVFFGSVGKGLISFQNKRMLNSVKKQKQAASSGADSDIVIKKPSSMSGEEFAAIAAAIYMYNNELHDTENTILTFENKVRSWTPWNAKLYGMNTYFRNRNNR